MTPETHDDGFHEIQLTGKQLVFLFMAATVVSVVIFLCGVLVGRGVRMEQLSAAAAPQAAGETGDAGTRPARSNQSSTPLPALPPADPAAAPPPVVNERVDAPPPAPAPPIAPVTPPPVAEVTRPAPTPVPPTPAPPPAVSSPPPSPARTVATPPAAAPKPPPPAPATQKPAATSTSAASTPPAAKPPAQASAPGTPATAGPGGWQVQVAAYDARGDAEAHVRRLGTKGYKAYVATPAGTSNVFRVRIGPFANKAAADAISARLSKEERITPWVTR